MTNGTLKHQLIRMQGKQQQQKYVQLSKNTQVGQPKVKIFLRLSKFMKYPQTKFYAHTKRDPQVIRSKFIIWSNFSCSTVFSLYRYF